MAKKTVQPAELEAATRPATVSLVVYQQLVDRCARERLDLDIANGSAPHARILIDKLFEIARTTVVLVSGTIRNASRHGVPIYAHPKLMESAKRFLALPDSRLDIVVQKGVIDHENENKFLRAVINEPSRCGTVALYIPNPGVLHDETTSHFMVSDRSAYRFETGIEANPDNERITAVANFGDLPKAQTLASVFDDILALLNTGANMREMRQFAPRQTF